jgi:hypothetical protein
MTVGPALSSPQAFFVSRELPATIAVVEPEAAKAARFLAAFSSRSITSPQASHRKVRTFSGSSALASPQLEQAFDDG